MKKYLVVILICCLVLLTGCTTEKTRNAILDELSDNKLLSSDWSFLSMESVSASPIPAISHYNYFYEDESNVIHCIQIGSGKLEGGNDLWYDVFIIDNLEEGRERKFVWDSDAGASVEKEVTCYNETSESETKHYKAYNKSFLLWKWWEITEAESEVK